MKRRALRCARWRNASRCVATTDLYERVAARAQRAGLSFYLLGATEEVNRKTYDLTRPNYPRLRIVGRSQGYLQGAALDAALDFLEARGLSNFALVGHCSGAWLALNGALADERVRDLFLVNLQRFIWTGKEDLEKLMAQAYRATDFICRGSHRVDLATHAQGRGQLVVELLARWLGGLAGD